MQFLLYVAARGGIALSEVPFCWLSTHCMKFLRRPLPCAHPRAGGMATMHQRSSGALVGRLRTCPQQRQWRRQPSGQRCSCTERLTARKAPGCNADLMQQLLYRLLLQQSSAGLQ